VTLSAEQAAAVPLTFITAWMGLIDAAQVREGETVVVFGASGGVGAAVTQLAHWRGARVIGIDHVPPAEDVGTAAQPDVFVGTAVTGLVEAVREATGGRGADAGFDAVGGSDFGSHLGALALGGRLAVIASVGERYVSFDLIEFYRRDLRLLGVDSRKLDAVGAGRILDRIARGFVTGALTPPRIAARFPLARAREAYEVVARGDQRGRVVLVPR
jgi:NADPH:quinone reductase